eukprot:m.810414 g.810414  ORF g.810414 m.810414 type:complete len:579 (+) comp23387_c0_seq1:238-1974(+)
MVLPAPVVRYGKYALGLGITVFLVSTVLQSNVSDDSVSSAHTEHSQSQDEKRSITTLRQDSSVKGSILTGTEKKERLPLLLPPVPLHEQFNHRFAPIQSVVFTMAFHDKIETFKLFVGSLRWTGYSGHIFIGVIGVTLSEPSRQFLLDNNVRIKEFAVGACDVNFDPEKGSGSNIKCSKEHPKMKAVWAQFLFILEWLEDCTFCREGVVIADIEVFFQRDPFVANVEPYPIMLFEEHPDARTTHWLVDFPVGKCKGKKFDKPMISAGILMGSRKGMLFFLTRLVNEFDTWSKNPSCHFPFNGDIQAIVNYLYYAQVLPAMPVVHVAGHREGVANIVGVFGTQVQRDHGSDWEVHKGGREWLPTDIHNLIDDNGFFLGKDMAPSAIVYQWESFGDTFKKNWLKPMQELVFLAPHARGVERPTALPVGFGRCAIVAALARTESGSHGAGVGLRCCGVVETVLASMEPLRVSLRARCVVYELHGIAFCRLEGPTTHAVAHTQSHSVHRHLRERMPRDAAQHGLARQHRAGGPHCADGGVGASRNQQPHDQSVPVERREQEQASRARQHDRRHLHAPRHHHC